MLPLNRSRNRSRFFGLAVPQSSLDLDFLSGTLDPRITFTRASSGTFFGSNGLLQTATNDVPRFDYDPVTRAARGLLIEEQRTNSVGNNTMIGAVAGTPGTDPVNWFNTIPSGITQQIVGTGTENGITYIDYRFFGTTTGSVVLRPELESIIVASSGQSWTGSVYARVVAGNLNNLSCFLNMRQGTAAGALVLNTNVAFTPTTAALSTQYFVNAVASMQATTERIAIRLLLGVTGAIDITLRIGLPQLEQGAFATSVIPTAGVAVTRAADLALMTGANFLSWFNASEGTASLEFSIPTASTAQSQVTFGDGASNERIIFGSAASRAGTSLRVIDGGSDQCNISLSQSFTLNQVVEVAGAYAVNNFAISQNGATPSTDSLGSLPTVNTLYLGSDGAGTYASCHLRRLVYWPVRVPNSQLQFVTA